MLIILLEYNISYFKKRENAKQVVDIKNISTFHVKIFELNSKNDYRKSLTPFRADIYFNGLVFQYEGEFEFEDVPKN